MFQHVAWQNHIANIRIEYRGISIWYQRFTVVPPQRQRETISHKVFITEYVSLINMTNTSLVVFYERRCAQGWREEQSREERERERERCVLKSARNITRPARLWSPYRNYTHIQTSIQTQTSNMHMDTFSHTCALRLSCTHTHTIIKCCVKWWASGGKLAGTECLVR